MRQASGRKIAVDGRSVYVEESGSGPARVVFEAGQGCGRTCWDTVLPLLADDAHLVAYDRAGFGRSGRTTTQLSIDDMAADLAAMVEAVVPGELVLVAHSMGGLVARRAAELLEPRLKGLLLVDPTPETAPAYDTIEQTTRKVDRMLAVGQALVHLPALRGLAGGNLRSLFPAETYETMVAEDFVPDGVAQTRKEARAVAAAIPSFREQPPRLPRCPTVLLSAARSPKGREEQYDGIREHQRRYAESLPDGRFVSVDCGHFIQAERPEIVAEHTRALLKLGRTTGSAHTAPPDGLEFRRRASEAIARLKDNSAELADYRQEAHGLAETDVEVQE